MIVVVDNGIVEAMGGSASINMYAAMCLVCLIIIAICSVLSLYSKR